MQTKAVAHPNIALLKYWGKQDRTDNVPATPSLSITLDTLTTTTTVADARRDSLCLNGHRTHDEKILRALHGWRQDHAIPPLAISSRNNFPTAAGLASSASGFAALATAIDGHCRLGLSAGERSEMARRGSGSAARSIEGGFVVLEGPQWRGKQLSPPQAWPLTVIIAITSTGPKAVSSSDGMARTQATSPYYDAWLESAAKDLAAMRQAVLHKDFATLAVLAEASSLKMHALMLTSRPPLMYWSAATTQCLHSISAARDAGCNVFATVDAGPQVKAVCLREDAGQVEAMLKQVPGVQQTLRTGLGAGAKLVAR